MKKVVLVMVVILLFPLILAHETVWIMGDSLSLNYDGEGYPPQLDELTNSNSSYYNLAVPGQTCDYVINYEIPKVNGGDYAIVLCGINDIYLGDNSSQVIQDIEKIYLLLQEKNIIPIFLTLFPNEITETCETVLEVNSRLRDFTPQQSLILVDTYDSLTDGNKCDINEDLFQDYVHLNKKGNSLIAELIAEQAFNKTILQKTSLLEKILNWLGL